MGQESSLFVISVPGGEKNQHNPGGLVGYPRAYKNHLLEFKSRGVHILVQVGTFYCIKKMIAESARA